LGCTELWILLWLQNPNTKQYTMEQRPMNAPTAPTTANAIHPLETPFEAAGVGD